MAGFLSIAATTMAQQAERAAQPVIHWRGDATCPRPASLEQELAARTGPSQSAFVAAEFDVEVAAQSDGAYALSVVAKGHDARERRVELASCAEAQRAAAMLIASALVPAPAPAPAPAVAAQARGEPEPLQPPWSLRASGLMDLRSVPQLTGGLGLGAGYRLSQRFQAWVDMRYLFARTSRVTDARAKIDLFALALGVGMIWSRSDWVGGPLLELELGALRGRASQDAAGSRTLPWVCPWGGASVSYSMGRLALGLAALLGVPIRRPEFTVNGGTALYRTSPIGGRALLTLSIGLGAKKSSESGQ